MSDAQLLAKYVMVGDTAAFDALVDRHQADLLRLAHALMGEANAAQDAVQEGFLALCQHAKSVSADAHRHAGLGGWLCTAVRNRCLDQLRRRRAQPLPDDARHPTPAAGLASDEASILWTAVDLLPPLERAAVILRYRHDLPYDTIAQQLGKTANHVGVILNQAMQRLRAHPALRTVQP
jgi:RNA polymerase sigma-70 factor (ECF subfamily)